MNDAVHDWSSWIKEGHFISYSIDGATYYEMVRRRDFGHWEWTWEEAITTLTESGPYIPGPFEITKKYDEKTHLDRIWQFIFGIKKQCYIYVELPTDLHRHGIPKDPKPSSANRRTSHFTEWMSPFMEPTFLTEHFLQRDSGLNQIAFDAYNPTDITLTPELNLFINKLELERLGTESIVDGVVVLEPTETRFDEVLNKLYRRVIPQRPITLEPIRAPAAAN